ncbi:unnamed protein product [Caenorhabditis auriculariae]|uniref:Uncharacterized protein n=1 Tax=Caenorhabditis auriculariae TaxID=2777116 RepID=A0A8S1HZA8_9PELO|nr:unnamed protein product [Caenorhabditis auriculariae]
MAHMFPDVVAKTEWAKPEKLTAKIAGVAPRSLKRAVKSAGSTPQRRRRNVKTRQEQYETALQNFDLGERNYITELMTKAFDEETYVNIDYIADKLREEKPGIFFWKTTLFRVLRAMGYSYKKRNSILKFLNGPIFDTGEGTI